MFGTYRLFLALAVALSHAGLIFAGFNPGQWSVICFYVLSGFLMEKQFHKLSPVGGVRAFYLDRFLRIYPVYFAVTLFCALAFPLDWFDTLLNFSLLPINYYIVTHVPLFFKPAWSLACEVQFYLVVPFLALAPTRALRLLLGMSLTLFTLSVVFPDNGLWAFTTLPGIIFTFVSGILINRREWPTLRVVYAIAGALFPIFLALKSLFPHVAAGLHVNICIGYLIAIPATAFLCQLSPKVAWDQFLGLFSYPLFLVHTPVLNLMGGAEAAGPLYIFYSLLAAAILVLLVEKPSDFIRYRMRKPLAHAPVPLEAGSLGGPNRI